MFLVSPHSHSVFILFPMALREAAATTLVTKMPRRECEVPTDGSHLIRKCLRSPRKSMGRADGTTHSCEHTELAMVHTDRIQPGSSE